MDSELTKLDVIGAAERQGCSPTTVRRYIKMGILPAAVERVVSRNGRPVHKIMIQVSDLDAAFKSPHDPAETARYIEELVDTFPPLDSTQRYELALLLFGRDRLLARMLPGDGARNSATDR